MASVSPILTVDVEEWFHLCGHPVYSDPARWDGFASRVEPATDLLLAELAGTPSRATFFVLGWVARRHPHLVRRIAAAGHEVACHGDSHRRAFDMTPQAFREDVRTARKRLEDLVGSRVTAYRAPEWSLRTADSPFLAILVEEGFEIDSSLMAAPPVGPSSNPRRPTLLETPSGPILEVPPLCGTFFGWEAPLGGGWTARLSRESRVRAAIHASLARGVPPVLYLHPWELDEDHPSMRLGFVPRLVHFAGLGRALPRLRRLLAGHRFEPVSSARAAGRAAVAETAA